MRILILPGIGNSGPGHWQTLWQAAEPNFFRVQQRDWEHPRCEEWVNALEHAVVQAGPQVTLVAHSLGGLLVAHWAHWAARSAAHSAAQSAAHSAATTLQRIRAALLVALPDPAAPSFPTQAIGFAPVPMQRLPFATLVVASSDDPYSGLGFAQRCAAAWGGRIKNIGAAGHINADSGVGQWPAGRELLRSLTGASVG